MVVLQRLCPESMFAFKEVRLWALSESPMAFGSSYAKESLLSDDEWRERVANWNVNGKTGFLAMNAGKACGVLLASVDEEDPRVAQLISM